MSNIREISEKYGIALEQNEIEMSEETIVDRSFCHSFTGRRY